MKNIFTALLVIIPSLVIASPAATVQDKQPPELNASEQKPEQKKPPEDKTATRGQLLYKNHCGVCHESNVHIREKKKARTLADIYTWVNKWSDYRKLEWSEEDIRAVVNYLNLTYYQYTK